MRRVPVDVPESVSPNPIATNFVLTEPSKANTITEDGPILFLHGFDSSLLEFRRLLPEMREMGAEAYAVDVLGWGFTEVQGVAAFGAGALLYVARGLGSHSSQWRVSVVITNCYF